MMLNPQTEKGIAALTTRASERPGPTSSENFQGVLGNPRRQTTHAAAHGALEATPSGCEGFVARLHPQDSFAGRRILILCAMTESGRTDLMATTEVRDDESDTNAP